MRCVVLTLAVLVSSTARADSSSVAVLDIQGTGIEASFLPTLTEVLTVEIDNLGKYKVIAGRDVQAMIGFEKQKDVLGCTDASCLAEIGGALGVDRIVASHIGKVGSTYVVNIKLINIRKADTEGRVYETVQGEVDALLATIRKSVGKLFGTGAAAAVATPAAVAPSKPASSPKAEAQPAQQVAVASPAAPPPSVTAEAGSGSSRIGTGSIVLWSVGGGGVVLGGIFGIAAKGQQECANDPGCVGGQVDAERAEANAKRANIFYGVGLLSAAAGTVLMFLGNDEPATAWAPLVSDESVGVAFSGRF